MNKKTIICITTLVILLAFVLSSWPPWQRQPMVFYEPLFLPLGVIEGDIIALENGSYIVIDEDKRINSIAYRPGAVTMQVTVHRSLWQLLFK